MVAGTTTALRQYQTTGRGAIRSVIESTTQAVELGVERVSAYLEQRTTYLPREHRQSNVRARRLWKRRERQSSERSVRRAR